ncbi:MAG: hypothetical protein KIH00_04005 [Lachnospiraceae bacterium]|nr:hypothetical protein [Lachnospiraceae bacterium]MDY5869230.1 hypothetical protein [Lachnospiraceae bacterium]
MKKSWIRVLAVAIVGCCLTGCGNRIPDMTEQQQDLVVEYAASELLKYDTNYQSKLTVLKLEPEPEEIQNESPEENEVVEEEQNTNPEESVTNDSITIIDNTGEAESQNISIESFLNLDGVEIAYDGYETVSSYPETKAGDEVYFYMSATEGSKLLVLKFLVKNISGEELELDMTKGQTRYKVNIDGMEENTLTTMLLDDMAYYSGTLAAGESVELVLVCEVPDEKATEIGTLQLKMKNVDNSATISLN